MTLNSVIALILRFSPNSIALLANYVTVVENSPIMSVKYCLPVSLPLLAITNTPCSAVSAIAELLVILHYENCDVKF